MTQLTEACGVLLFLLVCAGCSTVSSVEKKPLSVGATRLFHADSEKTVTAAKLTFADLGLKFKGVKQSDNGVVLLANHGMSDTSYGEVIRVLVIPWQSGSAVRVVCERVYVLNATSIDFTEDIFTRIGQRLGEYP